MSQSFLQIVIFGLVAVSLILYVLDPSYVVLLVKVLFTLTNLIFALFVFRQLIDMNNHYKSKFYPILFLLGAGTLVIPSLILISLFFNF